MTSDRPDSSPGESTRSPLNRPLPDIGRLPPLPASVTEALLLLNSPNVDMRRLATVLSRDPALTSRLLRVANSPFYGLSGRIATVKDACILLGIHTVRSILLAAGAMERFPTNQQRVLDRDSLWQHSLFVASAARLVATTPQQDVDTAFAAGLLHDLGRLLLDELCPEGLRQIPPDIDENDSLFELEHKYCGIDHASIGATVANKWHLPAPIIEAIAGHHHPSPDRSQAGFDDIVHVSDALCRAVTQSHEHGGTLPKIESASLARLGATGANMAAWIREIRHLAADRTLLTP